MYTTLPPFIAADETTFRERYNQFAGVLDDRNNNLWHTLNNEAAFQFMRAATLALDLPAVAGITRRVAGIIAGANASEVDHLKKGIGAIVCHIMETNGFEKTGTKRAVPPIPERLFRRAEVYMHADF